MNEKILNTKKNGLGMLLLWGILYLVSIGLVIFGGTQMDAYNYAIGIPVFEYGEYTNYSKGKIAIKG